MRVGSTCGIQGHTGLRTLGIVCFLLLASCGTDQPRRAEAASGVRVPVHTIAATLQDSPAVYEATGTVRARTSAVVASKVTGYVQQVNVQAGDRVVAGQILLTVDARDLEANYRRAEAGRAEVESAIPESDSAVAAARAGLDLAQVTFKRMGELYAKKSISNQEFDEASSRLKAAQAGYEMACARRSQMNARLEAARQESRAAAIARDYARIAAPFVGIVTAKSVEPGSLAMVGAPLLTIERSGAYRLEAAVDESKLGAVRLGQSVRIAVDSPGCNGLGRVSEIVPAVDAGSRSYTVRIDVPPSCATVRSGMFGRAAFASGMRKFLAVPSSAVVERGQIQSVFAVENGSARTRLITTGARSGDLVEVLSGLTDGDAVVAPVPAGLSDGAAVEVRP